MSDKATDTRPPYFVVEEAVIDHYELDPFEGWLYIVLVKHANRKTGESFPGLARLAKLTRMSRSQVIRCIQSLEQKKLIRVERDEKPVKGEKRQRTVNHYFLLQVGNDYAKGSSPQTLGVVPDSDYPSSPQTLGVVPVVDRNKNQIEQESNNNKRAGARVSPKVSKSEQQRLDKLQRYDATIRVLLKKFKPDVDWNMVRPCDMYAKEIDRYTEAAEIFEGFNLTAADLPAMFKYLDAKGWPSYGVGKIAECAPDFAGYKAKHTAAQKIIQDNPELDLSIPQPVIPILLQREKIAPAAELEDAS